MKRKLKFVFWTGTTLVVLVVALLAGLFILDMYRRDKAKQLVRDLQELRIGESAGPVIERLAKDYGVQPPRVEDPDCEPPSCKVVVLEIRSPLAQGVTNHSPWLGRLALRAWLVGGVVRADKAQISNFGVTVFTRRPDGCWLLAGADVKSNLPDFYEPESHIEPDGYYISGALFHAEPEHGEVIDADLTPLASKTARQHAFTFNWDCMGTFRGCQELCELYPEVWRDWSANQARRGLEDKPKGKRRCDVPTIACDCGGCEEPGKNP